MESKNKRKNDVLEVKEFEDNKYYFVNIYLDKQDLVFWGKEYIADVYTFENEEEYNLFIKGNKDDLKIKKEKRRIYLEEENVINVSFAITTPEIKTTLMSGEIIDPQVIDPNNYRIVILYPTGETFIFSDEGFANHICFTLENDEKYEKWDAERFEEMIEFEIPRCDASDYYNYNYNYKYFSKFYFDISKDFDFANNHVLNTIIINGIFRDQEQYFQMERLLNSNPQNYVEYLKNSLETKNNIDAQQIVRALLTDLCVLDCNGDLNEKYKNLLEPNGFSKKKTIK